MKLTEPVVDDREVEAVRKILESGWLTEGEATRQFERKVAEYVGAEYAIATCNCTVALELCLKAYDIQGEVVVPDFTHPATANAVVNAGATPVLVDVNLDTYNINFNEIPRSNAMIPVSWAGNPLGFYSYYVEDDFQIVEDAACSLGAEFATYKTGSLAPSCFSFHPRKIISCGQGGMVTTNNEELATKIRALKNFGYNDGFKHKHGTNYKFNDVSSAIGLAQMEKINSIIEKRIKMAKTYDDLLANVPKVKPPQKHPLAKHTYQTYAVYLETGNRDQIIAKLAEKDIETQIGTYALHLLPAFKDAKRIGSLSNAEKLHYNLLALPMSYKLTEEDQKCVVTELKSYVR